MQLSASYVGEKDSYGPITTGIMLMGYPLHKQHCNKLVFDMCCVGPVRMLEYHRC